MPGFEEAADALYAASPDDFVATRTRLARDLPDADASRLRALRRPTLSAWAVNRLRRNSERAVSDLLDLGERMRAAWSAGEDIGGLERERGPLVAALVRSAATMAGRPLPAAATREVEDTLQAAISDEEAARAVREGRLVRPLTHSGFGLLAADGGAQTRQRPPGGAQERSGAAKRSGAPGAGAAGEVATDGAGPGGAKPSAGAGTRRAKAPDGSPRRAATPERAAERAREAEQRAARAEKDLLDRDAELAGATAAADELEEEQRRLRAALSEAERRRIEADRAVRVATRERDRAARTAKEARRAAERARAATEAG